MHHIKEITLILIRVGSLQQLPRFIRPDKVSGRHAGRAKRHGKIQERPELDLPVAQDVRIRSPSGTVFLQKIGKDPVPVLFGKVHAVVRNTDQVAHIPHVPPVFLRGAGAVFVLFLPVFHKDAHDIIALLLQKQGRNGGIHASAHTNHNTLAHLSSDFIRRASTFSCISAAISSRVFAASTTTNRSGSRAISS